MIYNDLNESIYFVNYDRLTFYFSSKLYMNKFKKEYPYYIKEETNKLEVKFKCTLYCDELLLLLLYRKIEKRGFRVLHDDKEINQYSLYFEINMIK